LAPDPSLEWVINGKLTAVTLSNNIYFDLVFSSPLNWIGPETKFPEYYYPEIKGQRLHNLYFTDGEKPEWYDIRNNEGWLIYNNFYYGVIRDKTLIPLDSSSGVAVFKTSHAGILKK